MGCELKGKVQGKLPRPLPCLAGSMRLVPLTFSRVRRGEVDFTQHLPRGVPEYVKRSKNNSASFRKGRIYPGKKGIWWKCHPTTCHEKMLPSHFSVASLGPSVARGIIIKTTIKNISNTSDTWCMPGTVPSPLQITQ